MTELEPVRITHAVPLALGARTYDLCRRVLVMGIVDLTQQASSERAGSFELDAALALAEEMAAAGADIIDVGAGAGPNESTDEHAERVASAIAVIAGRTGLPVSIETHRASVADAAFGAGAVLGNDRSGFADPEYLAVAARHGASVVATVADLTTRVDGRDLDLPAEDAVAAVEQYLRERIEHCRTAGIGDDRVIFDAGLDCGKTAPQWVRLLGASGRLGALGRPLMLSASTEELPGELCGHPLSSRDEIVAAAVALGVTLGCRIVRVHDVEAARRVCRTLEAVLAA